MTTTLRWIFIDDTGWLRFGWALGLAVALIALVAMWAETENEDTWTRVDDSCWVHETRDDRIGFRTVSTDRAVYCERQR